MELSRLEQQMLFLIEIDKLKSIYRQNYLADGSRKENDSEHSWHLAMMVIILSEHFEGIDILKTLKMVLIHDMVEIYAGDTFAYDEKANIDKEYRERIAAQKIFSLLPKEQTSEYIELWQEFERMATKEALYASFVDRIQPLTLNICTKGKMWHEHSVSIDKVLKRNKIVIDKAPKIISEYVQNKIIEASEKQYFHNNNESENLNIISNISIISAGINDTSILADMNQALIRHEGSENLMNRDQLEERMTSFLLNEYKAVFILHQNEVAGYCLYKIENKKDDGTYEIYVRQYYIKPEFRRKGLGKRAFNILLESIFKGASYVKLDVLESNPGGKSFWTKVGFKPYSQSLRMKGKCM